MNVYCVMSEILWETIPILDGGSGPSEPYRIADIIVAESESKARWIGWKTDSCSFTGHIRDMPRLCVRKIASGVDGPERVVTEDPAFEAMRENADWDGMQIALNMRARGGALVDAEAKGETEA